MGEEIFVGLMSGTSQDGVDAAAVTFGTRSAKILGTHTQPLPDDLRGPLDHLAAGAPASLAELGRVDLRLGEVFAEAVLGLLADNPQLRNRITAIGSHGHTVWHEPPNQDAKGFSLQFGDPNIIAARTGIMTVADFRRMDMALGGQGAPLVPLFHQWLWAATDKTRVIANLGGIANITVLYGEDSVLGFDTGPGNTLMDSWAQQHLNRRFDAGGDWARRGILDDDLLGELLKDPYLRQAPPKSTGREYFNLSRCLPDVDELEAVNVARTLLEFTARSLGMAVREHAGAAESIILVGGGSYNTFLRERISACVGMEVTTSDSLGVPADWVEAAAFAWLARARLAGQPGNLPSVTGAHQSAPLGGVYSPE